MCGQGNSTETSTKGGNHCGPTQKCDVGGQVSLVRSIMGRGKLQNHVRPGVTSIETSTMSGIHLDRLEGVTSMGKDLQDGQSWHAIPSEKMGAPSIFPPFPFFRLTVVWTLQ